MTGPAPSRARSRVVPGTLATWPQAFAYGFLLGPRRRMLFQRNGHDLRSAPSSRPEPRRMSAHGAYEARPILPVADAAALATTLRGSTRGSQVATRTLNRPG